MRNGAHTKLWTYGFGLVVAAASLSVFVARAFDSTNATASRYSGTLMAIGLSCAVYFLWVHKLVHRVITSHPSLRLLDRGGTDSAVKFPVTYRLLNPRSLALFASAAILLLLPSSNATWGPAWMLSLAPTAHVMSPLFFVAGGVWITSSEGAPRDRRWNQLMGRFVATAPLVIAWGGFLVLILSTFVEMIGHAEAGLAMVGVACVPVLFLAGVQILRWLAFDDSLERMENLRLEAELEDWDGAKIRQAYSDIETARAIGPVPGSIH
jgi:hypothetical protein